MTTRLSKHPKAHLLARLPRVGQISHAQPLAELGPILDRTSSAEHAAAEAGATPVTHASGKSSSAHFRLAANQARQALHIFADNARHSSPWAATLYANAPVRGKRHPQAMRILGRTWLQAIWATGTPTRPTTRPGTAPSNASPPDDLTQQTQTLPRPGDLRSAQPDGPQHPHPSRLISIRASSMSQQRDELTSKAPRASTPAAGRGGPMHHRATVRGQGSRSSRRLLARLTVSAHSWPTAIVVDVASWVHSSYPCATT
jgi:Transposase IS116/IS110/IS902 family